MTVRNVLLVVIITAQFRSGLQSDVTLTCPEKWHSGETTTLYCEVLKSSINKCDAATPESTFFNLDPGTGSDIVCPVDSSDYSTCNYVLGSTPLDCGCQQNSTHYTFVYQFKADKNRHNGNWDCIKSCFAPSGPGNPLTKDINPFCSNVDVKDNEMDYLPAQSCKVIQRFNGYKFADQKPGEKENQKPGEKENDHQSLPRSKGEDGLEWWAILLITIAAVAVVVGITFLILHFVVKVSLFTSCKKNPYQETAQVPVKEPLSSSKSPSSH